MILWPASYFVSSMDMFMANVMHFKKLKKQKNGSKIVLSGETVEGSSKSSPDMVQNSFWFCKELFLKNFLEPFRRFNQDKRFFIESKQILENVKNKKWFCFTLENFLVLYRTF